MTGRIADAPLAERRVLDAIRDRQISEGLTRRRLAVAAYERAYLALQRDRLLRAWTAFGARLRGR